MGAMPHAGKYVASDIYENESLKELKALRKQVTRGHESSYIRSSYIQVHTCIKTGHESSCACIVYV